MSYKNLMRRPHCGAYCSLINFPFPSFLPTYAVIFTSNNYWLSGWLIHSLHICSTWTMVRTKMQGHRTEMLPCLSRVRLDTPSLCSRPLLLLFPKSGRTLHMTMTPFDFSSNLRPKDPSSPACSFGTSSSHRLQMVSPDSFSVVFEGF